MKLLDTFDDADLANWRRMVEVNLLDAMNLTREAPPHLKNNGATWSTEVLQPNDVARAITFAVSQLPTSA
jgi:NADP-dependent 3-hydroxy acid dehydrogenase YdfG